MTNRVLDQRYELQELVGGGGMADVYKAHDKLLDRPVAVKILHAQFKSDEEFIKKFHREAQAAARLSHPNIVNIYDVGVSGDDHYIVMEYVPGRTLKELIKQEGHLPVSEALRITREIADALANAHAHNLVHCDIKPHNILVMPDGHTKVADFGIARAVTESTMTYSGNVIGSVHYFSPEQAKGSLITPKSDVYSLGVVLYEMLTGQLPFRACLCASAHPVCSSCGRGARLPHDGEGSCHAANEWRARAFDSSGGTASPGGAGRSGGSLCHAGPASGG